MSTGNHSRRDPSCYVTNNYGSVYVQEQIKSSAFPKSVKAEGAKFAVDCMLCGLGRQLRKCGVDCIELPLWKKDEDEFCRSLILIKDEGRIILSQGNCVSRLRNDLPNYNHIYNVPSATSLADQLGYVLHFFNIVVRKEDIFSRCQICNSNRFTKVSGEVMAGLMGRSELEAEAGPSAGPSQDTLRPRLDPPINAAAAPDCTERGFTSSGVRIQVDAVPHEIARKTELFYACDGCGKVFWEGSHLERALLGKILRGNVISGEE